MSHEPSDSPGTLTHRYASSSGAPVFAVGRDAEPGARRVAPVAALRARSARRRLVVRRGAVRRDVERPLAVAARVDHEVRGATTVRSSLAPSRSRIGGDRRPRRSTGLQSGDAGPLAGRRLDVLVRRSPRTASTELWAASRGRPRGTIETHEPNLRVVRRRTGSSRCSGRTPRRARRRPVQPVRSRFARAQPGAVRAVEVDERVRALRRKLSTA